MRPEQYCGLKERSGDPRPMDLAEETLGNSNGSNSLIPVSVSWGLLIHRYTHLYVAVSLKKYMPTTTSSDLIKAGRAECGPHFTARDKEARSRQGHA